MEWRFSITWWVLFCITYSRYFVYIIKNHETVTDNSSIKIQVSKIRNRIIFKIKTGHYLEIVMSELMKLLGSTKSNIAKDKNCENVPQLEIYWSSINTL